MTLRSLSVLVVGAGIAGLALARMLALRGADVTVLEQAPAITEVGAGLQISPNGTAVLRAIGLDNALRRTGTPVARRVILRDARDRAVQHLVRQLAAGVGESHPTGGGATDHGQNHPTEGNSQPRNIKAHDFIGEV